MACLVDWQLSPAAGTSSFRLWGPFLQFSGKHLSCQCLQTWSTSYHFSIALSASVRELVQFDLPWFISSTTRKGQLVRSWSDTRYRIVETDRSYKQEENTIVIIKRYIFWQWIIAFDRLFYTPPDWWWALNTFNWPVCLRKNNTTIWLKKPTL